MMGIEKQFNPYKIIQFKSMKYTHITEPKYQ